MAIAKAVEDISLIHPEMKKNFKVGTIQAWYSDPTAQGAFASLQPFQIQLIDEYLLHPYPRPNELPKMAAHHHPPLPPPPLLVRQSPTQMDGSKEPGEWVKSCISVLLP